MFRLYLGCESESCVCVCALGTPIVCAGDLSNSLYKRMKYCLRRLLRLECLSLYFPSLSMLVRQQSCLFAGALTSSPHFTLPTNHKRAVRLIYEAGAGITRKVNFQRSQSQSDAALKQQILCQLHLFFFFFLFGSSNLQHMAVSPARDVSGFVSKPKMHFRFFIPMCSHTSRLLKSIKKGLIFDASCFLWTIKP